MTGILKLKGFWIGLAIGTAFCALVIVADAYAWTKKTLPRDEIYYEINNDNGDHGNFIETYRVPDGRGGRVYCIVYSDKIGDGGGAGISCDWGRPS
jgi:hypothetical protein